MNMKGSKHQVGRTLLKTGAVLFSCQVTGLQLCGFN